MAARGNADRAKVIQERLQVLLTQMLKDDDNKYCSMQQMGNSRARAVYEANLPDGFHRPQNDQAMEQLIRAKYEKKKYIAHEYVPSQPPDFPEGWYQLIEAEKQKKDIRKLVLPAHTHQVVASSPAKVALPNETARPKPTAEKSPKPVAVKVPTPQVASAQEDLLGLGLGPPINATNTSLNQTSDADFLGLDSSSSGNNGFSDFVSATPPNPTANKSKSEEEEFFSQGSTTVATSQGLGDGKMSKDSILALFGQSAKSPAGPMMQNSLGGANFGAGFGAQASSQSANAFAQGGNSFGPMMGGGGGPQQSNFGSNPLANPFLMSQSQPNLLSNQRLPSHNGGGMMTRPGQPGTGASLSGGFPNNQQPMFGGTHLNQVQNQMSGLNLGKNFNGIPLDPASPSGNNSTSSNPPTSSTVDIMGLW
eukprot:maker-scaffold2770_size12482-snap-gene-0.4 protein:Tk02130 transcript:maker-scaffold2770_size12482-snap-gene-0.4-mRNA-1 annotation:"stromal membrane-associated protein 1 isoform x2"